MLESLEEKVKERDLSEDLLHFVMKSCEGPRAPKSVQCHKLPTPGGT